MLRAYRPRTGKSTTTRCWRGGSWSLCGLIKAFLSSFSLLVILPKWICAYFHCRCIAAYSYCFFPSKMFLKGAVLVLSEQPGFSFAGPISLWQYALCMKVLKVADCCRWGSLNRNKSFAWATTRRVADENATFCLSFYCWCRLLHLPQHQGPARTSTASLYLFPFS